MTFKPDHFGFVDESCFSLAHPRVAEETAPTLVEAVVDAFRYMSDNRVDQVSVCTCRWDEGDGCSYEDQSLLTLRAHDSLGDVLNEEEAA